MSPDDPETALDREKIALDREKWADEIRLRQQEIDIKALEASAKSKEQDRLADQQRFAQLEAARNRWWNPLVVAVLAAAVAATGNAIVALLNGTQQRTIEQIKADQGLILEAIKANSDPDKAATNLRFLAETALISNQERRAEIVGFLSRRRPGEGPALPSANPSSQRTLTGPDLFQQKRASIGFLTVNAEGASGEQQQNRGTCFIVNEQGYALTAAHLFPEGTTRAQVSVSIGSIASQPYRAELIRTDNDLGLALVKIRTDTPPVPAKLSRANVQIAQTLFVLGFPASSDLSLLAGAVTSLDLAHGGIGLTAMTSPGMSGSPIFNDVGEVVAVVIGRIESSGMTVAYPIHLAAGLLSLAGVDR